MTQEEQFQTLYNWVQYLYGKVMAMDKEIKELKAQSIGTPTAQPEVQEGNPFGLTVETAIQVLDEAYERGHVERMNEIWKMRNPQLKGKTEFGGAECFYKRVKSLLETTIPTKPGERVGQTWLDYQCQNYKLKEPRTIQLLGTGELISCDYKKSLGAHFAHICEMWYNYQKGENNV